MQHAREDERVDQPGRAEQQREPGDALRLQQQERHAEQEQVAVAPHLPRLRRAAARRRRVRTARVERQHERRSPATLTRMIISRVTRYRPGMPGLRRYTNGRSSVAGAGVDGRALPGRRAGLVGGGAPDGQHGQRGDLRDGVHARRVPERVGERAGEPVDDPLLAVEVVHRERAARREVIARGLRRLQREQVALQAQRTRARDQRQRVGQREQDQVVLLVDDCCRNARPSSMCTLTRGSCIGVVGLVLRTEALQRRVDLDRVDVRARPGSSAIATSVPVPAPTISTRPGWCGMLWYGSR